MIEQRENAHIDREFSSQPFQLRRVRDEATDTAHMRLLDIYSLGSETINNKQIVCEHIWALVIFVGDVLGDGIGERDRMGATERKL